MPTPMIVLVHGAWGGGWVWDAVVERLRERGLEVRVVEQLPSASGDPALGLAADAEHLRSTLESIAGPAMLVAHSYGGMVISQLASAPRVAGAVYLTAFLPEKGSNFIETAGGALARWIDVDEAAGLSRIAEAAAAKVVTRGLSGEDAEPILARLGSQSLLSFTEPSENAAWGEVPVTYIVCTKDRVVPKSRQREMAAREPNAAVVKLKAGHFAIFTAVDETAQAIADAALRSQSAIV